MCFPHNNTVLRRPFLRHASRNPSLAVNCKTLHTTFSDAGRPVEQQIQHHRKHDRSTRPCTTATPAAPPTTSPSNLPRPPTHRHTSPLLLTALQKVHHKRQPLRTAIPPQRILLLQTTRGSRPDPNKMVPHTCRPRHWLLGVHTAV